MTAFPASRGAQLAWRTPAVILICGCLIAILTFGPRSTLGFFLKPWSEANGWGRDVFALALAIQNLLWGIGQPFAGAVADRFGTVRVISAGAILYALGLALMAKASTPGLLDLSAGVLIGFGLSGCSFNIVLAAFGKLVPESWRSLSLGAGTAAGSLGQFLFSPLGVLLIDLYGWQTTLVIFAALMLLILPLALVLATPRAVRPPQLRPAGARLLHLRFPARLHHCASAGLSGRPRIVRSGRRLDPRRDRHLQHPRLARRRLARQSHVEAVPALRDLFGPRAGDRGIRRAAAEHAGDACLRAMGLLWLSTVPPTSALVALMFGTRWLAMLFGFAFFSHQVGGFLGVWLGGILFERTGSYDVVWWLAVLFGVLSALINLPIVEKPVARPLPAAA